LLNRRQHVRGHGAEQSWVRSLGQLFAVVCVNAGEKSRTSASAGAARQRAARSLFGVGGDGGAKPRLVGRTRF
jgi:hypothetical protein